MKKLLLLCYASVVALVACAQNPPASPRVSAEGKNVKVDYGQPSKKGRVIFGGLQKYGEVWRAGANAVTEVTFAKDALFAGQPVKAGTYSVFVIPNEKEWTVILNSNLGFWGTEYEKNKDKDVLKVNVPTKKLDNVVEKLTYRFTDNSMIIEWDQTQVEVPLTFG
jgi:hypothetical protein